ncbi:undecaprenyl/decaprenyl-phosphate alpha-N-acetylglucosaminyl 1-phosphate transferase [Patescibacteria group bacterium]|nr:undecaprenyl/decaprenyl-phosphate alpha-N-acetylglucosaminyl 1-phosphate transferase [Patescibacteria group bacterium]
MSLFHLAPLLISFVIALVLVWPVRYLANKYNITDSPAPRKVHDKIIPLMGGVAVFLAFIITTILLWNRLLDGVIEAKHLIGIIIASIIIMIGGILDDKFNLRARYQILFPIIATIVVIVSGIGIKYITNPLGGFIHFDEFKILLFWYDGLPYYFTVFADLFTFAWLMGMMYVTKLLDGLDGLASGIGVIGSFIIYFVSLFWDIANSATSILALIVAGSLLGFLIWNWHPAKIFLGEGGSVFIGFILGVLAIISGGKIATALLVMGIPILDVAWVIIRRVFFNHGRIAQADRKHLHHRLLDTGLSHRQTVIFLYVITGIFGLVSISQQTMGKLTTLGILVLFMAILAYILVKKTSKQQSID